MNYNMGRYSRFILKTCIEMFFNVILYLGIFIQYEEMVDIEFKIKAQRECKFSSSREI